MITFNITFKLFNSFNFYLFHGMDYYVLSVCTDLQENLWIPSIDTLKSVDPCIDSSLEVILVDFVVTPA